MPGSPCGPHCLSGSEATVGRLRTAVRLSAAAGVVLAGMLVAPVLPVTGRRSRERVARWVFRSALRAFGVRLSVSGSIGAVPGRGALVVNNHVSWLDIIAINAVQPMRAVAKRDIATWPVLGRLVSAAGSVYVDRERLRTLPGTVTELAGVLRNGSMVNVTPEGTTWCGRGSGRFRPALFQSAIDGGVPVIPVAVRFRMADGRETTAPAFIGEETLLDSVRRVARLRGLVMEVHLLGELAPGRATGRHELSALAESAISSALGRVLVPRQQRRRVTRVVIRPETSRSSRGADARSV
jgi:1-acyl-sn-glycerol-3-phosphate acyltransferase